MNELSQLELRDKYMQLCKKLSYATEEGKVKEECQQLEQKIKELEPLLIKVALIHPADLP